MPLFKVVHTRMREVAAAPAGIDDATVAYEAAADAYREMPTKVNAQAFVDAADAFIEAVDGLSDEAASALRNRLLEDANPKWWSPLQRAIPVGIGSPTTEALGVRF